LTDPNVIYKLDIANSFFDSPLIKPPPRRLLPAYDSVMPAAQKSERGENG